jgi:hypothetical protein
MAIELNSSGRGFTCGSCGQWVLYGTYHYCFGAYQGTYQYQTDTQRIISLLEDISKKLDEIKRVLEK